MDVKKSSVKYQLGVNNAFLSCNESLGMDVKKSSANNLLLVHQVCFVEWLILT